MDITSYLLGKNSAGGGGGGDLSEYFYTEITENTTDANRLQAMKFVKKYPDIIISSNVTQVHNLLSGSNNGYTVYNTETCPKLIGGENVSSFEELYGCYSSVVSDNIKYIDVSGLNVSTCQNFRYMFKNRSNLLEITGLEKLEGNVGHMFQDMFNNCNQLTRIDLKKLGNSTRTKYNSMFYNCRSLTFLDIRSLTFNSVSSHTNMFGSSASNGVPDNCEIIVKDNDAKSWINTNYSRLTNVKTVAEYEG